MATILAYTMPALGNLYPMCALLRELRGRGHRIVLRTLAAGVPIARGMDFEAEPIDERIPAVEMTDWMAPNARAALRAAFEVFGRRAAYEVADLGAAIDAVRPDALVIDANCWGAAAAAEASGAPWLSFWAYFPFLSSPGVPPFGPGLPPWAGWPGRIRDRLLRPMVSGVMSKPMLQPVNGIRAGLGLAPVDSTDELLRRAPLMLVASGEPFDYPRSGDGGRVHMIGPCEFDPPASTDVGWLDGIDRSIVLVATSTERQNDARLGLVAIEAMAAEPVHVVATFPCGVPEAVTVPPNATVTEFVPHGLLLSRAVCAITHGGMGATQKALATGVPVCVVPHGRDQFEVARRVEVSGCGTRLPVGGLTPVKLRASVLRAMSMVDGARRVAEGFAATGGVGRGADLLEGRLLAR